MRRRVGHVLSLWGPPVGLMVLIFVVSSLPDPPRIPGGLTDIGAHGLAYSLLGVLVLRALAGGAWAGITPGRIAAALAITIVYGLSDELHQRFVPGRVYDLRDLAADAVGAAVGVLLVWACSIVLSTRRRG